MTKLPQVSHERVVRALTRAGFYVLREGKHISRRAYMREDSRYISR